MAYQAAKLIATISQSATPRVHRVGAFFRPSSPWVAFSLRAIDCSLRANALRKAVPHAFAAMAMPAANAMKYAATWGGSPSP